MLCTMRHANVASSQHHTLPTHRAVHDEALTDSKVLLLDHAEMCTFREVTRLMIPDRFVLLHRRACAGGARACQSSRCPYLGRVFGRQLHLRCLQHDRAFAQWEGSELLHRTVSTFAFSSMLDV